MNYAVCHKCSGDGFTVEVVPVCCRQFRNGVCCNDPVPGQQDAQCNWCEGSGRIPVTEMSE